MTTRRRATVEDTLSRICDVEMLEDAHWATATRLMERGRRLQQEKLLMVPVSTWRAFYRRDPARMLTARRGAVRDFALELKAWDASAAALNAIDNVLSSHGIATTKPK